MSSSPREVLGIILGGGRVERLSSCKSKLLGSPGVQSGDS